MEDRQISAKSIAEELDISRERVESIIRENLEMRKALRDVGSEMPQRGSKKVNVASRLNKFWNFSA